MRKNTNQAFTTVTVAAFVVFTVLKLTGVIAWSWRWVTAPIWIPFLLAVIVVMALFVLLYKRNRV